MKISVNNSQENFEENNKWKTAYQILKYLLQETALKAVLYWHINKIININCQLYLDFQGRI